LVFARAPALIGKSSQAESKVKDQRPKTEDLFLRILQSLNCI